MDEFLNVLQAERKRLQQLLAQQLRWWQYFWTSDPDERVLRDPEVRKNIEILAARISDVIDLNRRHQLSPEVTKLSSEVMKSVRSRLSELLCEQRNALCLETLLDTRRSMELLLLEHPDLPLLEQRTAEEYAAEESTLLTWRRLYGDGLPELLNDSLKSSSQEVQDSTTVKLRRLVVERFELYRPLRARRRLRIIYLCYIAPVLLLAGLLFGLAIGMGAPVVLLAAATGATGAALSGLLKFRDEVKLGAQVREFPLFYLVQVGVGAVFGLFVDLFFATGWLTLAPNSAGIGVAAFAAGFSEPFALGIVAKIIKITERASI
jgi:hypothetical protein